MALLFSTNFSALNNSTQAGLGTTQRQEYTGGIITSTSNPIAGVNHSVLGNCLPMTLNSTGYRQEAYPTSNVKEFGETEVFFRFEFAVDGSFPIGQSNYFLCINQIHSANPNSSPPLEFDLYSNGLWMRGYNWTSNTYNANRVKLTTVVPGTKYTVVYGVKASNNQNNNRINVWVNGVKIVNDFNPGFPMLDGGNSYWKGATLYADKLIARPLTVFQKNHAMATAATDLGIASGQVNPPVVPEVEPDPGLDPEPADPNPIGGVPMPGDFKYAEVHVSNTMALFEPGPSTLIDYLNGPGESIATDLVYDDEYWIRLVAVDFAGNRSAPSAPVSGTPKKLYNIDLGPNAVDRINVRNSAIGSAEIGEAAINDAHIGNLTVGSLKGGKLDAQVIIGDRITTGTGPNRVEINTLGISQYWDNTLRTRLGNDGTALVTGVYRTALTGPRIEINPDQTDPDRIRFYSQNNNSYGTIESVAQGAATAVVMYGNKGDEYTGYVSAAPDIAQLRWGNKSGTDTYGTMWASIDGARVQGGVIDFVVDYKTVTQGGNRVSFTLLGGQGFAFSSQLNYQGFWEGGNRWVPFFSAPNQAAGLKFVDNYVHVVNNLGSVHANLAGIIHNVSSREYKEEIEPYTLGDMSCVVPKTFYYTDPNLNDRQYVGFIAEELMDEFPQVSDGFAINDTALSAIIRARQIEQDAEIEELRRQVASLTS